MELKPGAILRELQALDALEKRVKQTVSPNQVMLREIDKKRQELLNPVHGGNEVLKEVKK